MIKRVSRIEALGKMLIRMLGLLLLTVLLLPLVFNEEFDERVWTYPSIIVILLVVLMAYIARSVRQNRWLSKRREILLLKAPTLNLTSKGTLAASSLSASMQSLGTRDRTLRDCYAQGDIISGEYSFAIYQKTKSGEYKAETVYYAVTIAPLPRFLPNVFFDARHTKGREFKKQFHHTQKHSLEGNFDTYFDSYFPTHYSLDTLSFITPEVMQSLIDASAYDIEISGNNLFLYGPLEQAPEQVLAMSALAQKIRKTLLNNIQTYRDQRLAYDNGRQWVSVVGMQLRRNLSGKYLGMIGGALLLICFGLLWIIGNVISPHLLILGGVFFITNLVAIIREHLHWQALDKLNKIIS